MESVALFFLHPKVWEYSSVSLDMSPRETTDSSFFSGNTYPTITFYTHRKQPNLSL